MRPKLRKGADQPLSLWSAEQRWGRGRFTKCNVAHSSCGTLTVSGEGARERGASSDPCLRTPLLLEGSSLTQNALGSKGRAAGRPGPGPEPRKLHREGEPGAGLEEQPSVGKGGTREGGGQDFKAGGRTGTKKQAGQARAVHRKPRIAPDRSPGNVQGSSEGEGQQVAAADCGGPGTLSHAGPTSSCRKYSFTGFSRFLWRRCVKQVI